MELQIDRIRAALADRYDLVREVGAGGMATVYLAEDVKHHRNVAVKVLRPELAAVLGGERFVQEIETTAKLQHPHILPLFDSGEAEGFLYYVMPFIDGETLREKLNRETQLGIDEAVRITTELADALDYAHRQEVIHRDIKPENILLQDGRPMMADFGIAIAVSAAAGGRLTETGLSVGTPYYMSPEQATADRDLTNRSDIYSLGSVLYEMLAGEPPHTGASAQAIVMKILTEDAQPLAELRKSVPANVAAATVKALEKLSADRFESAAKFAEALKNPFYSVSSMQGASVAGRPTDGGSRVSGGRAMLPWIVSAVAIGVAGVAILGRTPAPSGVVDPVEFVVPLDQRINQTFAISRDGRHLAASGQRGGLFTRAMNSAGITSVPASEGRVWAQPTFSPDGAWVAYVDIEERELRRVSTAGGAPVPIAAIPLLFFGQTWGPQDTIVWGRAFSGLWAVPVEGGRPVQLTVADTSRGELGHWYPQFLPGGSKVLFSTYRPPFDSTAVEVLDLETRERTVLFQGGAHARYIRTGHIVYSRGETLWAVPFDLSRTQVTGPGVPVREGVSYDPTNARGGFSISDNGTLAYVGASVWNSEGELMWVDRNGSERPLAQEPGVFAEPALSPDGDRLAVVSTLRGEPDVWAYDLVRGEAPTRVTRNVGLVAGPTWTLDGSDVVYSREGRPYLELARRDWQARTSETPIPVAAGSMMGTDLYAYDVTPDGRIIVGTQAESWDIWTAPLDGVGDPVEFRVTEFHEANPSLSPGGRWVAYDSNESGPREIWIDPYPGTDDARRRHQITRGGGAGAQWGRGGELFYRDGEKFMSVRIDLTSGAPGIPVELFAGPYLHDANYAVAPDGQRFLMIKPKEDVSSRRELVVVVNWFEELRARTGNE